MQQRVQFRFPVELSVLSPRESVLSKMRGRYHRFCADNGDRLSMCVSCGQQRVATGIVQCCNGSAATEISVGAMDGTCSSRFRGGHDGLGSVVPSHEIMGDFFSRRSVGVDWP